jgi:hypothetical protein
MIYKKYEIIAQTQKLHWSFRQVAKISLSLVHFDKYNRSVTGYGAQTRVDAAAAKN